MRSNIIHFGRKGLYALVSTAVFNILLISACKFSPTTASNTLRSYDVDTLYKIDTLHINDTLEKTDTLLVPDTVIQTDTVKWKDTTIILLLNLPNDTDTNHYTISSKDFSIKCPCKCLKINDSVRIEVANKQVFPDGIKIDYSWKVNTGSIKADENTAIYYSPANKDSANISITISFENIIISRLSLQLVIYRQFILLKADDMKYETQHSPISPGWIKFIDYILKTGIKSSVGVIGESLNTEDNAYVSYLKSLNKSRLFELWNHGYLHIIGEKDSNGAEYSEFKNTSLEYQLDNLSKTQSLAKEKLGFEFNTFGAPGNAVDENTLNALEQIDEIKVWFFGIYNYKNLSVKRTVEIEYPCFYPDYQKFQSSYMPEKDYLALQIHPGGWGDSQFHEFQKIINFLKDKGVTFILPYEYYSLIQ